MLTHTVLLHILDKGLQNTVKYIPYANQICSYFKKIPRRNSLFLTNQWRNSRHRVMFEHVFKTSLACADTKKEPRGKCCGCGFLARSLLAGAMSTGNFVAPIPGLEFAQNCFSIFHPKTPSAICSTLRISSRIFPTLCSTQHDMADGILNSFRICVRMNMVR